MYGGRELVRRENLPLSARAYDRLWNAKGENLLGDTSNPTLAQHLVICSGSPGLDQHARDGRDVAVLHFTVGSRLRQIQ